MTDPIQLHGMFDRARMILGCARPSVTATVATNMYSRCARNSVCRDSSLSGGPLGLELSDALLVTGFVAVPSLHTAATAAALDEASAALGGGPTKAQAKRRAAAAASAAPPYLQVMVNM